MPTLWWQRGAVVSRDTWAMVLCVLALSATCLFLFGASVRWWG